MLTLTTPNAVFRAPDLTTLEDQLMSSQTFGAYPAYWWDEDDWASFDGRIWDQAGDAHLLEEDVIDYASWSLDVPADQIRFTVEED